MEADYHVNNLMFSPKMLKVNWVSRVQEGESSLTVDEKSPRPYLWFPQPSGAKQICPVLNIQCFAKPHDMHCILLSTSCQWESQCPQLLKSCLDQIHLDAYICCFPIGVLRFLQGHSGVTQQSVELTTPLDKENKEKHFPIGGNSWLWYCRLLCKTILSTKWA